MKNLRNKIKNIKGITLISLIITIIVLLILAGVVINMTLGNDGIISKAQGAVDMYKNVQEKEEYEIAKAENKIDEYVSGNRDYELEIKKLKDRIKELENLNSYSTTEEKIVGTWIDGKTLYQKTYKFANLSLSAGVTAYIGETNGLDLDYADVTHINFIEDGYYIGEGDIKVWIRNPNNNFGVKADIDRNGDLYFTIQYTKTTDQASN